MASGGCMKVIKYFLFLFNLLFFALGGVLLGFGIWILVDKTSFIAILHSSSSSLQIGSYILIGVGGVTMVMGFLGCIGAVNEVRCLLGTYFTFLLLILIAQVAAGVLIYLHRESLKTEMSDIIHELIVTYNPNDSANVSAEVTWDYIQRNLNCCGWVDYQNWTQNPIVKNQTDYYPCTCVSTSSESHGFCNSTSTTLYQKETVSSSVPADGVWSCDCSSSACMDLEMFSILKTVDSSSFFREVLQKCRICVRTLTFLLQSSRSMTCRWNQPVIA
ncbi:hypothetical protein GDO81_025370 [Engystomops pustulosus]|uniref:Tetraspanin n=1 Tax=Engystomops pustulosus TaxID=76066 RepID=A0AAV6ZLM8_ENGPU|nr:hypothetical protein GDO81_025370 [Engystomops pustulosus]